MSARLYGLAFAQALAEYGGLAGLMASAQRTAERAVAAVTDHATVVVLVLVALIAIWAFTGRRRVR